MLFGRRRSSGFWKFHCFKDADGTLQLVLQRARAKSYPTCSRQAPHFTQEIPFRRAHVLVKDQRLLVFLAHSIGVNWREGTRTIRSMAHQQYGIGP